MPRYWWEEPKGYTPAAPDIFDPQDNSYEFVDEYEEAQQAELDQLDGGKSLWEGLGDTFSYASEHFTPIPGLMQKAWNLYETHIKYRNDDSVNKVLSPEEIKKEFKLDVDSPMTRLQAHQQARYQTKMSEIEEGWQESGAGAKVVSSLAAIIGDPITWLTGAGVVKAAKVAYQGISKANQAKAAVALTRLAKADEAVAATKKAKQFTQAVDMGKKANELQRRAETWGTLAKFGAAEGAINVSEEVLINQLHKDMGYDPKIGWQVYGAAALAPVAIRFLAKGVGKTYGAANKLAKQSKFDAYKKNLIDFGKKAADSSAVKKFTAAAKSAAKTANGKVLRAIVKEQAEATNKAAREGLIRETRNTAEEVLQSVIKQIGPKKLKAARAAVVRALQKMHKGGKIDAKAILADMDAKLKAKAGLPKAVHARLMAAVKMSADVAEGMQPKALTKIQKLDTDIAAQTEAIRRSTSNDYKLFAEENLGKLKLQKAALETEAVVKGIPKEASHEELSRVFNTHRENPLVQKQLLDRLIKDLPKDAPTQLKRVLQEEADKLEAVGYLQARFGSKFTEQVKEVQDGLYKIHSNAKLEDLFPAFNKVEDAKKLVDDLKYKHTEDGKVLYKTDDEIAGELLPTHENFLPRVMDAVQDTQPASKMNRDVPTPMNREARAKASLQQAVNSDDVDLNVFSRTTRRMTAAVKEYTQCMLGGGDG